MKDGDVWQQFYNFVNAKNPFAIQRTKVKGHATRQMVEPGELEFEQKVGHDAADDAAENGSIGEQSKFYHLAQLNSMRQDAYMKFMHDTPSHCTI